MKEALLLPVSATHSEYEMRYLKCFLDAVKLVLGDARKVPRGLLTSLNRSSSTKETDVCYLPIVFSMMRCCTLRCNRVNVVVVQKTLSRCPYVLTAGSR